MATTSLEDSSSHPPNLSPGEPFMNGVGSITAGDSDIDDVTILRHQFDENVKKEKLEREKHPANGGGGVDEGYDDEEYDDNNTEQLTHSTSGSGSGSGSGTTSRSHSASVSGSVSRSRSKSHSSVAPDDDENSNVELANGTGGGGGGGGSVDGMEDTGVSVSVGSSNTRGHLSSVGSYEDFEGSLPSDLASAKHRVNLTVENAAGRSGSKHKGSSRERSRSRRRGKGKSPSAPRSKNSASTPTTTANTTHDNNTSTHGGGGGGGEGGEGVNGGGVRSGSRKVRKGKTKRPHDWQCLLVTSVEIPQVDAEHDPDAAAAIQEAIEIYRKTMRRLAKSHSATRVATVGDSFVLAFPRGLSAVRCALDVQSTMLAAKWPDSLLSLAQAGVVFSEPDSKGHRRLLSRGLRINIGMDAGVPEVEVDPVTGASRFYGSVFTIASNIANTMRGGQTVLSSDVARDFGSKLDNSPAHTTELGELVLPATPALKGVNGDEGEGEGSDDSERRRLNGSYTASPGGGGSSKVRVMRIEGPDIRGRTFACMSELAPIVSVAVVHPSNSGSDSSDSSPGARMAATRRLLDESVSTPTPRKRRSSGRRSNKRYADPEEDEYDDDDDRPLLTERALAARMQTVTAPAMVTTPAGNPLTSLCGELEAIENELASAREKTRLTIANIRVMQAQLELRGVEVSSLEELVVYILEVMDENDRLTRARDALADENASLYDKLKAATGDAVDALTRSDSQASHDEIHKFDMGSGSGTGPDQKPYQAESDSSESVSPGIDEDDDDDEEEAMSSNQHSTDPPMEEDDDGGLS